MSSYAHYSHSAPRYLDTSGCCDIYPAETSPLRRLHTLPSPVYSREIVTSAAIYSDMPPGFFQGKVYELGNNSSLHKGGSECGGAGGMQGRGDHSRNKV